MSLQIFREGLETDAMSTSLIGEFFFEVISDEDEKISKVVKKLFLDIAKEFAYEESYPNLKLYGRILKVIEKGNYEIGTLKFPKFIENIIGETESPKCDFSLLVGNMLFLIAERNSINKKAVSVEEIRELVRVLYTRNLPPIKWIGAMKRRSNLERSLW